MSLSAVVIVLIFSILFNFCSFLLLLLFFPVLLVSSLLFCSSCRSNAPGLLLPLANSGHHTGAVVDETSVIISSVSSELKGMIDGIDDHDSPQLAADVAQMLETLRSAYTEHMAEHQMDMLIDGV